MAQTVFIVHRKTLIDDGQGGQTETWSPVDTISGEIVSLSAKKTLLFRSQYEINIDYLFKGSIFSGVQEGDRLIDLNNNVTLKVVNRQLVGHKQIECLCSTNLLGAIA